MSYSFNHVHLKAPDPGKTADWYVKAFNFQIINDENPRPQGDRFIRCRTEDGIAVNISSARTDESMGNGDADAHWGLEHFGIEVDDIEFAARKIQLENVETTAITTRNDGQRVFFLNDPDGNRIEICTKSGFGILV